MKRALEHREPTFLMGEHGHCVIEVISGEHQENFQCCNVPMGLILPNTSEGASEKHLPVVERNGNEIVVKVGSVMHPMSEEHSIDWVYLETVKGCQRVNLSKNEEPVARFVVAEGDEPVAAYAFCNLHGFWKTEIE